jgi:transketolase
VRYWRGTLSPPPSSRCRIGRSSPSSRRHIAPGVLGSAPQVGIEAAVGFGWERWPGERAAFVGMNGFGASAPVEALYPRFGITPEKVAEAARSLL